MRKRILSAACALALTGVVAAQAQPNGHVLGALEKPMFCAVETMTLMVADMINEYGCEEMRDSGPYAFFAQGVLNRPEGPVAVLGMGEPEQLWIYASPVSGDENKWSVSGSGALEGNAVRFIQGECTFDTRGRVMFGHIQTRADQALPAEPPPPPPAPTPFINYFYEKYLIWEEIDANNELLSIVAKGLDVGSTRKDWPGSLWKQNVRYLRWGARDGQLEIRKTDLVWGEEELSCGKIAVDAIHTIVGAGASNGKVDGKLRVK